MRGWAMTLVIAGGALGFGGVGFGETRTYEVEVVNTWSTMTHPGLFPTDAHFSWFGGGVHSDAVSFWAVGSVATPGIKQMAETGVTTTLVETEVQAAIDAGTALAGINRTHWFCPSETMNVRCETPIFQIEVNSEYPLVTLASMLGPSPDWFVGVSGEDLREGNGWVSERVIDLRPYDGGTRSNNDVFELFGPLTDPPEPVSVITAESGQIITPASLGSLIFRLVIPPCAADFDSDGVIGAPDLATLLAAWGMAGETDLNGDGLTDAGDLAVLLAGWGGCV